MKTYARIDGDRAVEIIISDEVPIEEMFHPDLVATLVEVPDGTVVNSELVDGEWIAPESDGE